MLSSYMLLLNLILLIEVTFSTPTPAVVDNLLKLGDGIALRAFSTSQIRCERYSIIEAL
jgi:hypothetical protein